MKKHYGAIDGLRAFSCIGILLMHVKANTHYNINGFIYNGFIGSLGNLTSLFMVISAFGMCVGYYDKVMNNTISFSDFYKRRFQKTLPFFSILVLLDLVISPSKNALYEAFADLTLLFGFLPAGNISVIGVGWFLGLVFVFYLIFPFFCTLLETKRKAWIVFAISIIYNYVCSVYFHVGANNILYSGCFFIAGGLIYLYRDQIEKINKWVLLCIILILTAIYYGSHGNSFIRLLLASSLLIYTVSYTQGGGILENKITKFIGSISMEIYLSHMVIFRAVEKAGLHRIIGNGILQYILTSLLVIGGTIIFALFSQTALKVIEEKIEH